MCLRPFGTMFLCHGNEPKTRGASCRFAGVTVAKGASMSKTRCGTVAFVGRANVGKSTLMNHLVGQKISITSRRPQTTRHRIHGILTRDDYQIIIADTPGIHEGEQLALNRVMNQTAFQTLAGVDFICFVVDALKWTRGDAYVLSLLEGLSTPVFLVINKIDTLQDKKALLPHMAKLSEKYNFAEVVPVSALEIGRASCR